MYGTGISKKGKIIDLADDANILDKSGAWYSYNGEKIGQGKENVKALLRQNAKLKDEIEKKLRTHYGMVKDIKKEDKKEE